MRGRLVENRKQGKETEIGKKGNDRYRIHIN